MKLQVTTALVASASSLVAASPFPLVNGTTNGTTVSGPSEVINSVIHDMFSHALLGSYPQTTLATTTRMSGGGYAAPSATASGYVAKETERMCNACRLPKMCIVMVPCSSLPDGYEEEDDWSYWNPEDNKPSLRIVPGFLRPTTTAAAAAYEKPKFEHTHPHFVGPITFVGQEVEVHTITPAMATATQLWTATYGPGTKAITLGPVEHTYTRHVTVTLTPKYDAEATSAPEYEQ